MGGASQPPSFNVSSDGSFLDGGGLISVAKANGWASGTTTMPESDVSQEMTDKVLHLLDSEGMNCDGLVERIQLQYKALQEKNEQHLKDIREEIKGYRPGDGIHEVGGISRAGFLIPKVTTLLLVGFAGAGKSCLINNMIRVLDDVTTGFDRAHTYGDTGNGSLFLQEYYVCESSKHFCVFDSRGFSKTEASEDFNVIKQWMSNGVCHGEAVCRPSDSRMVREAFEGRGRQCHSDSSIRRAVNFAIFVVNAFTVHGMRESHDVLALEKLALLYKSPFLSFMDDVPVVVMTHGDRLTPQQRILTRIFVGELLGVSPVDHVFDISCFTERIVHPGDIDSVNDLVLLDMLKYALERADKNLPYDARAATLPSKINALLRYRWNGLGIYNLLMIAIMFWLLSAIFMTTLHNLRLNRGLRNVVNGAISKMHKKIRHGHK